MIVSADDLVRIHVRLVLTTSCRGDGLSVPLILNITGSEDSPYAGLSGSRDGDNVSIRISLELVLDESSGWFMADSVEQAIHGQILLFAGLDILDSQRS